MHVITVSNRNEQNSGIPDRRELKMPCIHAFQTLDLITCDWMQWGRYIEFLIRAGGYSVGYAACWMIST